MRRLSQVKARFAVITLLVTVVVGAIVWLARSMFSIRVEVHSPIGASVRTRDHVATLVQRLVPYVPSLHRNPANDRYDVMLLLLPLFDDGPRRLIPIAGAQPASALRLARIFGDDGRTLWFDAAGLGGLDLETFRPVTVDDLRRSNPGSTLFDDTRGMSCDERLRIPERGGQSAWELDPATQKLLPAGPAPARTRPPLPTSIDAWFAAGVCTSATTWLGVHTDDEVARDFRGGSWVKEAVRATAGRHERRLHRGVLEPTAKSDRRALVSLERVADEPFVAAAFVCADDEQRPFVLPGPDSLLMVAAASRELYATMQALRVGVDGSIAWRTDTGLDRGGLLQVLPGPRVTVFVGSRPPVPGKVSEPLVAIVDHDRGACRVRSLWQ